MQRRAGWLTTALALGLAACASGGGGDGGVGPISPPPPAPPPPPPPPASPADFENIEYDRDYSKALINASAAYAAGATGQGVLIAVIDTGIDLDHAEFIGKIHAASTDIYAAGVGLSLPPDVERTLDDEDGHGTGVASAAAGAKLADDDPLLVDAETNGGFAGMHGVAFGAQILAIRADEPDAECAPNCDFTSTAVAAAIDYAVANGADVINLSLGGSPTPDPQIMAALGRATAAGVLIVGAAGNADEGEAPSPEPDAPANFATRPEALGRAIIAGAVDQDSVISSFSNRAEGAENVYLVAPGEGIVVAFPIDVAVAEAEERGEESPCEGQNTCYSVGAAGTSFAAPQVAGALALLLDAFPALPPEDAVEILLTTAADLGAAGPDSIYGRGLLDLEAAFEPRGGASLSLGRGAEAASIPIELVTIAPAGATGDWITASGLLDGAIVRDAYARAFAIAPETAPAASSVLGAFETAAVGQRLDARRAGFALGSGSFAYAAFRAPDDAYVAHPNLATDDMLTPELSLTVRQGPLSFAMGRGFSAPAAIGGPSAATLSPTAYSGAIAALTASGDWASAGYDLGAWSLDVRAAGDAQRGFSATSISRRFGAHEAGFEVGSAYEEESALGGAAGSRLGGTDAADTTFAALAWRGPVAGGWTGSARIEAAAARLDMPAHVRVEEDPLASAWTLSLERPLTETMDLGVTLAQPLRAESGRVAVLVPVGVTKVNASVYEDRVAALTPSGREIDLETALRFGIADGAEGRIAVRLADDPGHVASADLETAVWLGLRWTR